MIMDVKWVYISIVVMGDASNITEFG